MQKIPTLFVRDHTGRNLTRDVTPGCEWINDPGVVASRKWDGTCAMIRAGRLYKRREIRKDKGVYTFPPDFELCEVDEKAGKAFGWVPVTDCADDRWHNEARVVLDWPLGSVFSDGIPVNDAPDGTYELLGPKVQGNPEGFATHVLIPHGKAILGDVPRDFDGLREWLRTHPIEGIVWTHPDGRRAKLKAKDFGFTRKQQRATRDEINAAKQEVR